MSNVQLAKVQKVVTQTSREYPMVPITLGAFLISMFLFIGVWGPVHTVLREGYFAETQRLLEVLEMPMTETVAKGDDLARIDQLRRVEKLPGVVSATVQPAGTPSAFDTIPLIWEGKNLGALQVRLGLTPWLRLRYACIERMWTLVVLMSFVGGMIGWVYQRRQKAHMARLKALLKRHHQRRCSALQKLSQDMEEKFLAWTKHATTFSREGLVLLDAHQGIAAFNPKARDVLNLPVEATGHHWLDIKRSQEWASALRLSLDHPGVAVDGPVYNGQSKSSLVTLMKDTSTIDSTWIVLH